MNSVQVKAICPHCQYEHSLWLQYNGGGIIEPELIRCQDEEATTIGCGKYFTIQGRVVTTVQTSVAPIAPLDVALRQNGNGTEVQLQKRGELMADAAADGFKVGGNIHVEQ